MLRVHPARLRIERTASWVSGGTRLAVAALMLWLTPGVEAQTGASISAPGFLVGTGSISDCSEGWELQNVTVLATLSPDPRSLASAGTGGDFSGTWKTTGGVAQGCGTSQSVPLDGRLAGTIGPNGNVQRLEVTVNQYMCLFGSGVGFVDSRSISLQATVPASCVDPSLQGSVWFTANFPAVQAPISRTSLGPAGTSANPTGIFGEPVNTATGNFYASYTDLSVHGRGMDFTFNRYYNSQRSAVGPLGANWSHSYAGSLTFDPATGTALVNEASGGLLTFQSSGAGFTSLTTGSFDTLARNGDGSFTLTRKDRSKLTYSGAGLLTSVADRNGNAHGLAYSAAGDLTTITDSAGRVYALAYDGNHRITSLSDPAGRVVRYGYDGNGDLVSVTDPVGGKTLYSYDPAHRMVTLVDARGVTFLQNTYDSTGRVASQTNALGKTTRFSYGTGSTTIIDANGNRIQDVYDHALRLVQTINGVGSTATFSYNTSGLKSAFTDGNGHTTSFTYDKRGNTTTTRDPAGNVLSTAYDAADAPTKVTTPAGRIATLTYDARGNLLTQVDPAGARTSNTYDGNGQMLTSTDAAGNTWQYQYDGAGNRTGITDPDGRATTVTYDALGRPTSSTDGLGHTAQIQYDLLDRVVKRTDAGGNQTQYSYDAIGNLVKVVDANGNSVSYTYDGAGNRLTTTDALGQTIRYAYDPSGHLSSIINARGKTVAFAYDAANRLTKTTDELGRTRMLSYDAAGNLASITDGNGKVTRFTYSTVNRVTGIAYFDSSKVSFAYDADGNRVSMSDWNGNTSYSYDAVGRVASVRRYDGTTIKYGYDGAGRRTSLIYPNGNTVQSQYNGASRLTAVIDWSNRKTVYTYDAAGNLAGIALPNGVTVGYSYDAADRLAGVSVLNPDGSKGPTFSYSLDALGNPLQVVTETGTFRYAYDALARLISWTSPSGATTSYAYDATGNRISSSSPAGSRTYSYDDADEMLAAGTTSFTYDGNGSRVTKSAAGQTTLYRWDPANRLESITGPGGALLQYEYDGDGNRISQSGGAADLAYVNAGGVAASVLHEDGTDGSIDYVHGLSLIGAIGSKGTYYRTSDGMANTANAFDAAGVLRAVYSYDPWGNLLTPADPLGSRQKYKFAGQAYDSVSGLYYMRARYYDPSTGTFLSRDPLGTGRGSTAAATYSYAANNPLSYADPSGLVAEKKSKQDATSRKCWGNLIRVVFDIFDADCFSWEEIGKAAAEASRIPQFYIDKVEPPGYVEGATRIANVLLQGEMAAVDPDVAIFSSCAYYHNQALCTIGNYPTRMGEIPPLQRYTRGEDCERGVPGACVPPAQPAQLAGKIPAGNGCRACPAGATACPAC
ncbi:MAG TPA: RHS repeat-associated core domain-containing protein [Vicinamibacterales bacterium]